MNTVAIGYSVVALLLIGLSLPLVKRKIKRNPLYGIRIPESFKSEERWLEINEYGGRLMFRLGVILAIAAGIGLPLQKEYWPIYTFFGLAVIVVGLISVTALIFWYAAKTKKD